jgi:hypothetical protein
VQEREGQHTCDGISQDEDNHANNKGAGGILTGANNQYLTNVHTSSPINEKPPAKDCEAALLLFSLQAKTFLVLTGR